MSSQSRPVRCFLGNCETAYNYQGKDHLHLARALFHRCRVMILQGPMFMGKTRLAEEVAKNVDKLVNDNENCNMSMFSYMIRCGVMKRMLNGQISAMNVKDDLLKNLKKSHNELSPQSNLEMPDFFQRRQDPFKESFLFVLDELDCMPEAEVSKVLDDVCDLILQTGNLYFLLTSSVSIECPRITNSIHVHWCKQMKHKDAVNLLKEVAGEVDGLPQRIDSLVERFLRVPFYLMLAGQKMKKTNDISYTPQELLELTDKESLFLLLDSRNVPTKDAVGERHASLMKNMPQTLTLMFHRMCEGLDLHRTLRASEVQTLNPKLTAGEVKRGILQELRDICLIKREQTNNHGKEEKYEVTLQSLEDFNITHFVEVNPFSDEFVQRIFNCAKESLGQVLKTREIRTACSLFKYEKSCLFAAQKNLEEQQQTRDPGMKHALRLQLVHAACAFLHNCILDCNVQRDFRSKCLSVLMDVEAKEQGYYYRQTDEQIHLLDQRIRQIYVTHPSDSLQSPLQGSFPGNVKEVPSQQAGAFIFHPSNEVVSLHQNFNHNSQKVVETSLTMSRESFVQSVPSVDKNRKGHLQVNTLNQGKSPYSALLSHEGVYNDGQQAAGNDLRGNVFVDSTKGNSMKPLSSFHSYEMPAGHFSVSMYNNQSQYEVREVSGSHLPGQVPFLQHQISNNSSSTPPTPDGFHIAQEDQRNAYIRMKGGSDSHSSSDSPYSKEENPHQPKRPDTLTLRPQNVYQTTVTPVVPVFTGVHSYAQNTVPQASFPSLPHVNGLLPMPLPNQGYPSPHIPRYQSVVNGIQYSHVPNNTMVGQVTPIAAPSLLTHNQVRMNGVASYPHETVRHFVQPSGIVPVQTVNMLQSVPQGFSQIQHPQPYYYKPGLNNANVGAQSSAPSNFQQLRITPPPTGMPRGQSQMSVPPQPFQSVGQHSAHRYQYSTAQHLPAKFRPQVVLPPSRVQGPYPHHQAPHSGLPGAFRGWNPPPSYDSTIIHQKASLRTPPPQRYISNPNSQNVQIYGRVQDGNGYIG